MSDAPQATRATPIHIRFISAGSSTSYFDQQPLAFLLHPRSPPSPSFHWSVLDFRHVGACGLRGVPAQLQSSKSSQNESFICSTFSLRKLLNDPHHYNFRYSTYSAECHQHSLNTVSLGQRPSSPDWPFGQIVLPNTLKPVNSQSPLLSPTFPLLRVSHRSRLTLPALDPTAAAVC